MHSGKPKVAILTGLVDYSPAYSLVGIILDQARALKRYGYEYDLLCLKSFNKRDYDAPKISKTLSVKYVLPQTFLHDYQVHEQAKAGYKDKNGTYIQSWEEQIEVHLSGDKEKGTIGYKDILKEYDVVITHDIMFLSWHLPQNAAIRKCIDMWPEKTWLHWVHSGPSSRTDKTVFPTTLRFSAAPHSRYVYLNNRQKHEYALMINAPSKDVSVVYNPKDIRDVCEFDDLTRNIIDRYKLLNHEILQIYPFSTPRWRDKGVPQLMRIFAAWRKQGVDAKLVLINAHCNSERDLADVQGMEAYALACGLEIDKDIILTSRYSDETEADLDWKKRTLRYTVPFKTVRELQHASNMFIFPSVSECCSLIQAEASMAGKFMVLNRNFLPMLEFCSDGVMHFEFTQNSPDTNLIYYECVAREILQNFRTDMTLVNRTQAITRTYNADWIFKNQLEPLLYLKATQQPAVPKPKEVQVAAREGPPVLQASEIIQMPEQKVSDSNRPPMIAEMVLEAPDGTKIPLEAQVYTKKVTQTTPQQALIPESDDVNYNDPFHGMDCPIYGQCTSEQKVACYDTAGRCLMLDENVAQEQT